MIRTDSAFLGSIPHLYDQLLVPLIFRDYARDLARRTAAVRPRSVLELAAGTGVLTRELVATLPADTTVVATDLNQPMLQLAERSVRDQRVCWQQADALALPYAAETFDAATCQFGVMFFHDKVAAFREVQRVLRSSGSYFFNVWGRLADNDFARAVSEVLRALVPEQSPRFLERVPHGYHDVATISADLAAAGLVVEVIETVAQTSHGASAAEVAAALCQGTPLRNEIESRQSLSLADVTDAVAQALAEHFGDGRIQGRLSAHVIRAKKG